MVDIKEEKLNTRDDLLLEIKNLSKLYPIKRGFWSRTVNNVRALSDINLRINKGEIIGLVGESGCGKSTLGKSLLRLIEPTTGEVFYSGINHKNIFNIKSEELRKLRQNLQIVFQNPYSSLSPKMRVKDIIAEPIIIQKIITNKDSIKERTNELLNLVGLDNSLGERYPHELSGGQRQRVAIARALSLNPEFLVLDEPVSALDVSVQAQILNLLIELQKKLNLTYLFISHNLSVVSYISSKIVVMYLGKIVEIGTKDEIIKSPKHPYTKALLSSAPHIRWRREENKKENIILHGEIPDPSNPPSGCVFRTRCPIAQEKCSNEIPLLVESNGRLCACHFPD